VSSWNSVQSLAGALHLPAAFAAVGVCRSLSALSLARSRSLSRARSLSLSLSALSLCSALFSTCHLLTLNILATIRCHLCVRSCSQALDSRRSRLSNSSAQDQELAGSNANRDSLRLPSALALALGSCRGAAGRISVGVRVGGGGGEREDQLPPSCHPAAT
jgi:hypothetical protein